MTVSADPPSPSASRVDPSPPPRSIPVAGARSTRPQLFLSEIVVGGVLFAVALLAWDALALAHLGRFSLGAVVGVWAALLAIVAGVCWRWSPVSVRVDKAGSVGVVGLAVIAGVMVLPGFHYGVTDKDPGGYVAHAMAIARTGSYQLIDPTLDGRIPGGPNLETPGARFAGLWEKNDHSDVIIPQFYHLWPALLAVSDSADGERGISNTAPLIGVLAILAAALALRRAVLAAPWGTTASSLACGGIAGLLLATNMLEVWQAKYPSSEIAAQMLFLGSLLALVLAVATGWRAAAGAAGVLTGIGFLDRGDGVLLVGLAIAGLAVVIAVRRWEPRATCFAVGLAVVLPHALWQAYSWDAAGRYSADNDVPSLITLTIAVAVVLVVGFALRRVGPRVAGALAGRRIQLRIGATVTTIAVLLVVLGFLRPTLFGETKALIDGKLARTYDDQILERLSWFVSYPGFVLMLLGVAIVALRKWGGALWVLTVPLLIFFPVYAYQAHNSTRLMWWTRRFLPTVLPLMLVLVALVLGVALTVLLRRASVAWAARAVALACSAALVVWFVGESAPLRKHQEFAGSFALSARIAAAAGGQQGVFLWQRSPKCCLYAQSLFASAIWLERDQISALLPDHQAQDAGYIRNFAKAFPGQPLFVIWHTQQRPSLPGVTLTVADRVVTSLPYWEESDTHRPKRQTQVPVDFVIYRASA